MDTVQAIFTQLGVDSSLLPQFVIVVVVFLLAQFLFLRRLQEVLETREEKTVKLENSADDILEKVTRMQGEYKTKMEDANRTTLKIATDQKHLIAEKYTEQYKQVEKEMNQQVDQSRNQFSKEVSENKSKYLAEADALAQSLVQKILQ